MNCSAPNRRSLQVAALCHEPTSVERQMHAFRLVAWGVWRYGDHRRPHGPVVPAAHFLSAVVPVLIILSSLIVGRRVDAFLRQVAQPPCVCFLEPDFIFYIALCHAWQHRGRIT